MKSPLALFIFLFVQITCVVGDEPKALLEFFVIQEDPFENSKPISVDDLGVKGFRSEKPDILVQKLEKVTMRPSKWTIKNRDGTIKDEGTTFNVQISLDEDAQKRFRAVSADAIGKRLLIRIGDHPLLAPFVMEKIQTASFEVTFKDEAEAKKVVKALRRLSSKAGKKQGDARRPATAADAKSESNEKPKPETEESSQ